MNIGQYKMGNEDVLVSSEVRQSKPVSLDTRGGTLACTDHRVVFAREDEFLNSERITDISLDAILAVDYTGPTFANGYTVGGALTLFAAAIVFPLSSVLELDFGILLSTVVALVGLAFLIYGLYAPRSSVELHTPGKTYEFTGQDHDALKNVPHAIRGASA